MFPDYPRMGRRACLGAIVGAAGGFAPASARAAVAATVAGGDDLTVATVGSGFVGESLRKGALLAIERLNAEGGLLGHKLRLHSEVAAFSGSGTRSAAIAAATHVTSQPKLIAVIGHQTVEDALPAAITYLSYGVPFFAPTISSTGLTLHGLPNLYATLPDNTDISVQTARIAFDIGLRRCVILRDRGSEALEVSLAYRDEAAVLGIAIVDERSLPAGSSTRDYMAGLQGPRFDHLLIIGPLATQVALVRAAAEAGLAVTCVLPTINNADYVRQQLGTLKGRVLMPVLRDRTAPTPNQAEWEKAFAARFGERPFDLAIQGTDAVGVLAEGLKRVGRIDLRELGRVLHTEFAYNGIGGRVSFRNNGRIYTRLLGFASIRPTEVAYYMPGA
jgi:branched-chain amino acid transport system substrate-binding protein